MQTSGETQELLEACVGPVNGVKPTFCLVYCTGKLMQRCATMKGEPEELARPLRATNFWRMGWLMYGSLAGLGEAAATDELFVSHLAWAS